MKLFGGVGRMTAAAGLAVIRIMMRIWEFFNGIFSIMTAAAGEIVRNFGGSAALAEACRLRVILICCYLLSVLMLVSSVCPTLAQIS